MNRIIGFGVLLLASAAVPATAQYSNRNDYGYTRGYGSNDLNVVRQHVRDCRQHEQLHEDIAGVHAQEHAEGLPNGEAHHDAHDQLNDAHDQYHEERGNVENCGYWNSQLTALENRSHSSPWEIRQHVRDCRRHAQLHQNLAAEHSQEHAEGVDSGLEHHDAHNELQDAHDQYHDEHGSVQNCDYWYSQNARLQNYGNPYRGQSPYYGR